MEDVKDDVKNEVNSDENTSKTSTENESTGVEENKVEEEAPKKKGTLGEDLKKYKSMYRQLQERFDTLEKREEDLSKFDEVVAELASTKEKLMIYEMDAKRLSAFSAAKSKLGDDFIIENEDKVFDKIKKFAISDSFESDVEEFLDLIKKPKVAAPAKPVVGTLAKDGSFELPSKLSQSELTKLYNENPDAYHAFVNRK